MDTCIWCGELLEHGEEFMHDKCQQEADAEMKTGELT